MNIRKDNFMGRQINFYMSKIVEKSFIEFLEQNQFIFLNNDSSVINKTSPKGKFRWYLYKQDYGDIKMNQYNMNIIDTKKSPVIQFRRTSIKEEEKKIFKGRLWIETQYYDGGEKLIKKNDIFIKEYQMLVRWIKKHIPYQEIKKGEYFVKEYINDEIKELQDKEFIFTT